MQRLRANVTIGFLIGALTPALAAAQKPDACKVLCVPKFKFEPTLTVENLFNPPRISELEDGVPVRTATAEREMTFELVLAVDIPTEIPRVGLTVEAIWAPFSETAENPFTGVPAGELGRMEVRDNSVELEFELNLMLIEAEQAGGWFESHFDVVDKFSPAERPGDAAAFTHKLNFEFDNAFFVFAWLPKSHWLRNIEVEGSLDFVATGLPQAGDVVGDELFLDNASPWSFSIVFVIPLAPFLE